MSSRRARRSNRRRCTSNSGESGIVGGREVRVDGVELEVRAREQLRQRAAQVVEAEPEPVHAGVDLQVIADALAVARRGGLHGARRARRRNRRRQPAVEQAIEIADAQRAEHQNLGADAGGPQRRAFLDVGAGQQIGAGLFERARHLAGAVAVGVRLDDGDHAGRRAARPRLALERGADVPVVRLERREIDAGDGRANHHETANSSDDSVAGWQTRRLHNAADGS